MREITLRVGVVYCGGCNPDIDREALVESLTKELGRPIPLAKEMGGRPDLVLLVNGCVRGCLSPGMFPGWAGKTVVVAGMTIDDWPVAGEEMVNVLSAKIMKVKGR